MQAQNLLAVIQANSSPFHYCLKCYAKCMYSILQLAFHIISGAPVYLRRTIIAFVKVRASPMLLIYWRVSEAAISSKHFPQVTNYLKSSVSPLTVLRSGMATGGKEERRLCSYAWGKFQLL